MSFPGSAAVLFPNNSGGVEISPSSSASSGVQKTGLSFGSYGAGVSNSSLFIGAVAVLVGLFIVKGAK